MTRFEIFNSFMSILYVYIFFVFNSVAGLAGFFVFGMFDVASRVANQCYYAHSLFIEYFVFVKLQASNYYNMHFLIRPFNGNAIAKQFVFVEIAGNFCHSIQMYAIQI